jgi:ureidoglycolate hydrolase
MCSTLLEMTRQSFAPFGELVGVPEGVADVQELFLSYWHGLYSDAFGGGLATGFLQIRKQPMSFTQMERHLRFGEIFIPVRGSGVLPVIPADSLLTDGSPDTSKTVFYAVQPGQAFLIKKGVWHFPPLPIGDTIDFFMVLPQDILSDIDKRPVPPLEPSC